MMKKTTVIFIVYMSGTPFFLLEFSAPSLLLRRTSWQANKRFPQLHKKTTPKKFIFHHPRQNWFQNVSLSNKIVESDAYQRVGGGFGKNGGDKCEIYCVS